MTGGNINKSGPRIFIAPLDWGLGHATRCIPVIRELIRQGAEVWIGSGRITGRLLSEAFPGARFIELPDYNITYSTGNNQGLHLLSQVPRALKIIKQEHRLLAGLVKNEGIQAIISDNRPGLWHKNIHSVYITHQLQFHTKSPALNHILKFFHHKVINNFDETWIPDDSNHTLSGELSIGKNTRFCGPLSRLSFKRSEKSNDWLLLLSGPEPQRTILEKKLVAIFKGKNAVLVRGLPGADSEPPAGLSEVHNYAAPFEIENLIAESRVVVCRSGYSTIMDLSEMKADAVFIPTPGQSEQQYLAKLHAKNGKTLSQDSLTFEKIREAITTLPVAGKGLLEQRVSELLRGLK